MDSREVKRMLSDELPEKILNVEEISTRGERNHNFKVTTEGQNFIARRPKHKIDGKQETEKFLLDFLRTRDIDFVPESVGIYNDIHVITEVGEKDLEFEEVDKRQISDFIEKVVILHSLDVDELIEFSVEKGVELELLELEEDIERFSGSRLQNITEFHDEELIESLEKELEQLRENKPDGELEHGLIHDDLSGNVRSGPDGVYLIDWEFGLPGKAPEREFGYLFAHEKLNEKKERFIVETYAKEREAEQEKIESRVRWWEQVVLVGEIAYAIELQDKNKDYSERLEKWIERYNNKFEMIN